MSRQKWLYAAALALAAIVIATVAAFVSSPASAEAEDPALVHARAQVQWCQNLRQFDARNAADRAWADTCIRLAQREVTRLTPPSTTPPPTLLPTPTTPGSTPTSAPPPTTPPATSVPPSPPVGWPNPANTGVPAGWKPVTTRGSWTITAPGVYEDVRVNGSINVNAANVTLRRIEVVGGGIWTSCAGQLLVEDVTVRRGAATAISDPLALGPGSFTARRLLVLDVPEGIRLGEKDHCGPAVIEDSFIRVAAPDSCGDWHGDALQGWQGPAVTVRHSTFVMTALKPAPCEGTSPFFYPDQGNTSVTLDDVLAVGGRWYAFRLGTPGSVRGLLVAGEREVTSCAQLSVWDARRATVDADYQPTAGAVLTCGG